MTGKPVFEELAAAAGGRLDLTGYVGEVRRPSDPTLKSLGATWEAYTTLLGDDQVHATLQQRRLALTAAEWQVEPGGKRRIDREAADFLREQLHAVGWDRITARMHYGVFYGFAVAELLYRRDGARVAIADIKVRPCWRFRFDRDGGLRLLGQGRPPDGTPMPERKFWVAAFGSADDDEPYGIGIASALYWPVWLKRNAMRFWAIALEKFGAPTAIGEAPPGASPQQVEALLAAAEAVATEQAVVLPAGQRVSLLESARAAGGDHAVFVDRQNAAVAKVVLSQTMTTDDGSSRAQASVHMDVRNDVVKSDADALCETFNRGPAVWLTEWNFPGAAPPRVWRNTDEPLDLKAEAERDEILARIGWQPSEARIQETYGEGYERRDSARDGGGDPAVPRSEPGQGPAAFAAPPDLIRGDDIDVLGDRLIAEQAGDLAALIDPVRRLLDGAGSLEEVAERLLSLYPQMGVDGVAERLARAMAVADLMGRAEEEP